jgi:glutamine cyclotransferase
MNWIRKKLRKELQREGKVSLSDYSTLNIQGMPSYCKKFLIPVTLMLLFNFTISCSGRSGTANEPVNQPSSSKVVEPSVQLIKMISPDENSGFKLHQAIKVNLAAEDKNKLPDSVTIYFDGKYVKSLKSGPWEYSIPSSFTVATGRKSLKVTAYRDGKPKNTLTRFMIIYSDQTPKKYGYRVIHAYPHDKHAFTQGLFFDGGKLYEGTGQETGSTLREQELETGKVVRQHDLDNSLFGEGITLYNDRIFQVTWRSKVGFVYNKTDFKLINKIYYSTEGWGLTTVKNRIVMSDGSNILYFFEPDMFTVVSKIEVYDNEKLVDKLNELEYIDGEIWANIWMTDQIARIDPVSGKVLGYINLKDLLPKSDRTTDTDVLNGIAYDAVTKRIFVTGKFWPKLFEIKLTE